METKKSIVVQVEIPGIDKEDCDIRIERDTLYIRGEKHLDREHIGDTYYLMERAYGRFERVIPLPPNVDTDGAKASCRNGVLTVELPKTASAAARRLTVK
jgi:HSP20 family protein